jgi:putative oxidoreductase
MAGGGIRPVMSSKPQRTFRGRLSRIRHLVLRASTALRWLPPTVARLTLGWVFLESGWGKLRHLDQVVAFFTDLGIPAPQFQAPLAAATEFVCGALLLSGLATRLASLPLIGVMIVAIGTARASELTGLSELFGFIEFLYIGLLLWLGVYGAGPISLDWIFAKKLDSAERPLTVREGAERTLAR